MQAKRPENIKKWEKHYQELLKFVEREGHCRVPARHVEYGFRLGVWVVHQRYKRYDLDERRRRALEKIKGWNWRGQEAKWERACNLLEQFVEREAHARVDKAHIEDGFKLGTWVMHQRHHYVQGILPLERITYLNQVPGWVWFPIANKELAQRSGLDEIPDPNLDDLVEATWRILFSSGPFVERKVYYPLAAVFHTTPIVQNYLADGEGSIYDFISEVFQKGIDYGFFDRPVTDQIRAVLRDARHYDQADWDKCLEKSITRFARTRDRVIRDCTIWAEQNMGLARKKHIRDQRNGINAAIDRAMKNGKIIVADKNRIRKV